MIWALRWRDQMRLRRAALTAPQVMLVLGVFQITTASFRADRVETNGDLQTAAGPRQHVLVLLAKWGFRLPTASAIRSVLDPDRFTSMTSASVKS
jgi:hypothetical protein